MHSGSSIDNKFQYLKFRIHNRPDSEVEAMLSTLADRYPAFKRLQKHAHGLILFKYLVYLYDPGTELNKEFVRLADRRQEAARLSKLNSITKLPFLDSVFQCTLPLTLDCIQTMLREVYHDRDYREWQTLNKEYDDYISARWDKIEEAPKKRGRKKKGEDDEEPSELKAGSQNKDTIQAYNLKSKLREECQKIRTMLDSLDEKIFGDHDDIKKIAYKARFTSPESFVAAVQQSA